MPYSLDAHQPQNWQLKHWRGTANHCLYYIRLILTFKVVFYLWIFFLSQVMKMISRQNLVQKWTSYPPCFRQQHSVQLVGKDENSGTSVYWLPLLNCHPRLLHLILLPPSLIAPHYIATLAYCTSLFCHPRLLHLII